MFIFTTAEELHGISAKLDEILRLLRESAKREKQMSQQFDTFEQKIGEINDATNNLAAVVQALRDQISTGMSAAEVAQVQQQLDGVASSLNGIAADPNNPVPEPPPVA